MSKVNLFVDTNVFLDFYFYSKDDLDQLRKLTTALESGLIDLHLPQQVINELERNREVKLKTAADQFKKDSCPTSIPRHMQDYPQAETYRKAVDEAIKARGAMINQAAADASSRALAADKELEELFRKSSIYVDSDEIFDLAYKRAKKGNPPGKRDSIGDQYNWEVMLHSVPTGDLHIVSKDGDYTSILNTSHPLPFLAKEWGDKKSGRLFVYSDLRTFLDGFSKLSISSKLQQLNVEPAAALEDKNHVDESRSDVEMTADVLGLVDGLEIENNEKNAAIEMLVNSGSFYATHQAIAKLQILRSVLGADDAEKLLRAALDNNQIGWIASDSDVYAFFTGLIETHEINSDLLNEVAELFGLYPDDEDRDPFQD